MQNRTTFSVAPIGSAKFVYLIQHDRSVLATLSVSLTELTLLWSRDVRKALCHCSRWQGDGFGSVSGGFRGSPSSNAGLPSHFSASLFVAAKARSFRDVRPTSVSESPRGPMHRLHGRYRHRRIGCTRQGM